MGLRQLMQSVASQYPAYRAPGTTNKQHSVYHLVTQEIPDMLKAWTPHAERYSFKGSTGAGNVTPAPWIAVFDAAITITAQNGYYVVYLFSVDLDRVYLSLALGVTAFEEVHGGSKKVLDKIARAAKHLSSAVENADQDLIRGPINLAAESPTSLHGKYEQSNIVGIEYGLANLPPEDKLRSDFLRLLVFYEAVRQRFGENVDEEEALKGAPIELGTPEVADFVPRVIGPKTSHSGTGNRRRSRISKLIGDRGERIVFEFERKELTNAGRVDLAEQVNWFGSRNEQVGWDITSWDENGSEKRIEVKAATGKRVTSIELTANEWGAAQSSAHGTYWIYIVTSVFARKPRIERLRDPWTRFKSGELEAAPATWTVTLGVRAHASPDDTVSET